jgi:hypothetical protein
LYLDLILDFYQKKKSNGGVQNKEKKRPIKKVV